MDEAYLNKVELESRLEGLTDEINFYRQLYEEVRPGALGNTDSLVPSEASPSSGTLQMRSSIDSLQTLCGGDVLYILCLLLYR